MRRPVDDDSDALGREIARLAAQFVPDDSTIQFGVGTIPDAILGNLAGRRGLRVHSGLISEACIDLYEAGVIEGPMVSAEVLTTPRLLAWMDHNPAVCMGPASYTHGAGVIAAQRNFVALLSTVEVALDGACNSETAAGRIISGPGGAPDFAFGASLATGGAASWHSRPRPATGGSHGSCAASTRPTPPRCPPTWRTSSSPSTARPRCGRCRGAPGPNASASWPTPPIGPPWPTPGSRRVPIPRRRLEVS